VLCLTRMAYCPLHVRPLILAYRTELSPWPVLAWAPHVGAAPAWRRGGGRFVTLLRESHMELTAFSEEDFDAKAWVNAACARCAHTPARLLAVPVPVSLSLTRSLCAQLPRGGAAGAVPLRAGDQGPVTRRRVSPPPAPVQCTGTHSMTGSYTVSLSARRRGRVSRFRGAQRRRPASLAPRSRRSWAHGERHTGSG
jgi:hypothetical protein